MPNSSNKAKLYPVNESEHFNLESMYEHLKVQEIEMQEAPPHTYTSEQWEKLYERLDEVESLMEKAPYVGSLVDGKTLERIREIQTERQFIRYGRCMAQGMSESKVALSFE